jgi:uncharacterized protein (TIGR02453 family)
MFGKATFAFLDELAAHNDRAWFEANRERYESAVRRPALDFIEAMAPVLSTIAPAFRADTRKVGGSLMRVHRDTRFARDKTPYKTNVGIQFRHALGKDVHAPGFYVHVACDQCFLGVGCWRPDPVALGRIREWVASRPDRWLAARDRVFLGTGWALGGESLARVPRGFTADHPAAEDLKRKDFIGLASLSRRDVTGARLVSIAATRFAHAGPFMGFLCEALGVTY